MKEIKIKTPYGTKNWSFIKKLFDSHNEVIKTLIIAMNDFHNSDDENLCNEIEPCIYCKTLNKIKEM